MKITGKTLIDLGFNPGSWFKEAITYANNHQLKGEALISFLKSVEPKQLELREKPLDFQKNIEAESEDELSNLDSVIRTMRELMKTPTLVDGAVMPDACPTGAIGQIPVGGVAVAKNALHPAMHSADICCSVMMTNFGKADPLKVLDAAHESTHFGPGGREVPAGIDQHLYEELRADRFLGDEKALEMAVSHMGTQGDGNHFLFVGTSRNSGDTVMVTHHGSRGVGARLFKLGMQEAEKFRKELSPKTLKQNAWIPFDEKVGQDYWNALQLVRKWTKANHEWIHNEVLQKAKSDILMRFWNEHNFVFRDGERFFHAKGATPLDDRFVRDSHEGLRLIPLNMREPVLVVKGKTTGSNLGFAPHGAGRNVSRSEHIRRHSDKNLKKIFKKETDGLDVRFYSGNIDISELPSAYKNAKNVKKQMKEFNLGEIVDEIIPFGCIMAGDWKRDAPWKRSKKKKVL